MLRRAADARRAHRARRDGARRPVQVASSSRSTTAATRSTPTRRGVSAGDPHRRAAAAERDPGRVLAGRRAGSRAAPAAARGRLRLRADRAAARARHRDRRHRARRTASRAAATARTTCRAPRTWPTAARSRSTTRACTRRPRRVARRARGDPRRRGRRRAPPSRPRDGSCTPTTPRSGCSAIAERRGAAVGAADARSARGSRCSTRTASALPLDRLPGRRALAGERPAAADRPLPPPRRARRTAGRACSRRRCSTQDGRVRLAINVIEDITDLKRAEQGHRFLAEASRVLARSLDYEETLRAVARLAVPEIADWCAVDVRGRRRASSASRSRTSTRRASALAREVQRALPGRPDARTPGVWGVLRRGARRAVPRDPGRAARAGGAATRSTCELIRTRRACARRCWCR